MRDVILDSIAAVAAAAVSKNVPTAITTTSDQIASMESPLMFQDNQPDPDLSLLSSSSSSEGTDRLLYFNFEDGSLSSDLFPPTNWNHNDLEYDHHTNDQHVCPHLQLAMQMNRSSEGQEQIEHCHERSHEQPQQVHSQKSHHQPQHTQQQTVAQTLAAIEYSFAIHQETISRFNQQQQQALVQPYAQSFPTLSDLLLPQRPFVTTADLTPTVSTTMARTSLLSHELVDSSSSQCQVATPPAQLEVLAYQQHQQSLQAICNTSIYGAGFGDFGPYRSPTLDRLSSPDESSSAPASPSEQCYYSSSPLDYPQGQLISSDQEYFGMTDTDAYSISVAFSGSSLSGSSSSSSPIGGSGGAYGYYGYRAGLDSEVLPGSLIDFGTSTHLLDHSVPIMIVKMMGNGTSQSSSSSSTSSTINYQGILSTTPTQSSPLRQQFSSCDSSEGYSQGNDGDEDEGDSDEEDDAQSRKRKKKRARRTPSTKAMTKPKAQRLILRCAHAGCLVTCSSYPSLARHQQAHKWRGQYSPVRCAACQSSLSNEFSVQRHILRSPESSRCRRMRVYSIMSSETEIETTVRFYPGRAHGKKTVRVDLNKMKEKYP
ncbi:hypothetical protein BGZ83_000221 [Gryganskiella cystojenkinii]|nr:hypothetical protein BGZ83_000221 [Gryganskiella cystojenkinii]